MKTFQHLLALFSLFFVLPQASAQELELSEGPKFSNNASIKVLWASEEKCVILETGKKKDKLHTYRLPDFEELNETTLEHPADGGYIYRVFTCTDHAVVIWSNYNLQTNKLKLFALKVDIDHGKDLRWKSIYSGPVSISDNPMWLPAGFRNYTNPLLVNKNLSFFLGRDFQIDEENNQINFFILNKDGDKKRIAEFFNYNYNTGESDRSEYSLGAQLGVAGIDYYHQTKDLTILGYCSFKDKDNTRSQYEIHLINRTNKTNKILSLDETIPNDKVIISNLKYFQSNAELLEAVAILESNESDIEYRGLYRFRINLNSLKIDTVLIDKLPANYFEFSQQKFSRNVIIEEANVNEDKSIQLVCYSHFTDIVVAKTNYGTERRGYFRCYELILIELNKTLQLTNHSFFNRTIANEITENMKVLPIQLNGKYSYLMPDKSDYYNEDGKRLKEATDKRYDFSDRIALINTDSTNNWQISSAASNHHKFYYPENFFKIDETTYLTLLKPMASKNRLVYMRLLNKPKE